VCRTNICKRGLSTIAKLPTASIPLQMTAPPQRFEQCRHRDAGRAVHLASKTRKNMHRCKFADNTRTRAKVAAKNCKDADSTDTTHIEKLHTSHCKHSNNTHTSTNTYRHHTASQHQKCRQGLCVDVGVYFKCSGSDYFVVLLVLCSVFSWGLSQNIPCAGWVLRSRGGATPCPEV